MWTSEHRLLSFDATPLFFRIRRSETKEALGRVILLHGMGEHGGRYLPIAEHLSARGMECVVPDLRGFGKSGGPRAFADKASDYHSDLSAVLSYLEKNRPQAPTFYLGHSFGGLLVSSYLAMGQVAAQGLLLSSPLFGIAKPISGWRHSIGILAAACAPRFTQSTSVMPEDLTHDEAVLRLYKKDPLIYHRITARLYREMVTWMAQRESLARGLRLPTLVLQAGDDRIVDKEKTRLFYAELAAQDKEFKIYPGLFHEILNENERQEIFQTISDWILKRINYK